MFTTWGVGSFLISNTLNRPQLCFTRKVNFSPFNFYANICILMRSYGLARYLRICKGFTAVCLPCGVFHVLNGVVVPSVCFGGCNGQ